jgi:hypothetical protein
MKLRIERRGGLAGLSAVGERDVEELTTAQRQALDGLVKTGGPAKPSPGADRFHYKVTLTDDEGTRAFEVPEDQMPQALASIPKIDL